MLTSRLTMAVALLTLGMAASAAPAASPVSDPLHDCRDLNDRGRAAEASACYAKALRGTLDPTFAHAAWLGLAHNLQWSGDAAGAVRAYRKFLEADPSDRLVTLEYIQVLRYRGAYGKAEKLCDRLLEANPKDADALSLRAEILFWTGNRAFQARRDAEAARTIAPELASANVSYAAALEALGMHREASEKLRSDHLTSDMARFLETRLAQETRMSGDAPFSVYNDSDGIHDTIYESLLEILVRGDHRLEGRVGQYTSSAPKGSIFSEGRTRASVREFSLGGSALVSPGMHFSLSGGGAFVDRASFADGGSLEGAGIRPIYRTSLEGTPRDRWTVALSSERQFLKVTPRAIDQAIRYDDVSADVRRQLGARAWVFADIGHRGWSDGNHSQHADVAASRTLVYNRKFNLDAGPSASFQAFARDMTAASGFFTPDRYSRYDSFMAAHGETGRTFTWELRGEGGAQQITSLSDFSPEWGVRARCSLRMGRVLRLFASYERKNYSLLSRGGWYQGFFISLGVHP